MVNPNFCEDFYDDGQIITFLGHIQPGWAKDAVNHPEEAFLAVIDHQETAGNTWDGEGQDKNSDD